MRRNLKGGGARARKRRRRQRKIRDSRDIERLAKRCGSHWFDPDTKRFFSSRIHEQVYHGCKGTYFVSSERYDYKSPRRYTVRVAKGACNINTVGEFQQYRSRKAAHTAARKAAERSCKR